MPRLDYTEHGLPLDQWRPPESPRRQRLPRLNPNEQAFCEAMVTVHFTNAAAAARHAFPETKDPRQRAKKLMRKQHVRYAIEVLRNRAWAHAGDRLNSVAQTLESLRALANDPSKPAYVRVRAASRMLKAAGMTGHSQRTQNDAR